MTERRVVVTGIGTINPLGNNIAEFFSNLEKGVSGAAPITHFDAEKFKTKFACEVKNYDWTQPNTHSMPLRSAKYPKPAAAIPLTPNIKPNIKPAIMPTRPGTAS